LEAQKWVSVAVERDGILEEEEELSQVFFQEFLSLLSLLHL
jgi:hypothetical protein